MMMIAIAAALSAQASVETKWITRDGRSYVRCHGACGLSEKSQAKSQAKDRAIGNLSIACQDRGGELITPPSATSRLSCGKTGSGDSARFECKVSMHARCRFDPRDNPLAALPDSREELEELRAAKDKPKTDPVHVEELPAELEVEDAADDPAGGDLVAESSLREPVAVVDPPVESSEEAGLADITRRLEQSWGSYEFLTFSELFIESPNEHLDEACEEDAEGEDCARRTALHAACEAQREASFRTDAPKTLSADDEKLAVRIDQLSRRIRIDKARFLVREFPRADLLLAIEIDLTSPDESGDRIDFEEALRIVHAYSREEIRAGIALDDADGTLDFGGALLKTTGETARRDQAGMLACQAKPTGEGGAGDLAFPADGSPAGAGSLSFPILPDGSSFLAD